MIKTKTTRRLDYRKYVFTGLLLFMASFSFAFLAQKNGKLGDDTSAANLSSFQAGYIISDYQMTNYGSMSEADIQNFLWSKGNCYNTDFRYVGTQSGDFSDHTPPTTWHVINGHTVCLAEENVNGESVAHIIWQAAQDYRINPQVLIVLLQKETGIITDPIPNSWDYQRAAGYGCPDTADCSASYYGLKNQIRNAAYLFRIVMDGNSSYYPIGNNFIQYNPNSGCGGSNVYIQNLATSALYRYTPYQPNEGALAAGYGVAPPCGAYGNRNFYSYFEDWFGGITWNGWPSLQTVLTSNRVAGAGSDLGLKAQAHVEYYGWLGDVSGGEMAGTAGFGARMEALQLRLDGLSGISYRAHVQDIGWMDYVKDGETAGTTGKSKQMEAVQIKLSDELAKKYDIYYRAHVAGIGWMDWVKNGEISGTIDKGLQMEALQVRVVRKETGGVRYSAHVQNYGWMKEASNGAMVGTTGQSLRVEAMKINLTGPLKAEDITYRAHVQDIGWMDWVKNGAEVGTTGRALRMEAIEIRLSEAAAKEYELMYRVHVAGIGWMDWVKNGEMAGTTGLALRLEAIEIKVEER